ncbi:Ig-like domain-containing protein [Pseudomonas crudilactis]|uniref:Ig-like domain-containing protein n=1 Tax=Pseudomonas crudilactis TaxID=2697028 RepID=UPI0015DA3CE4|nr:Ig-like domain-containing protein [Pseudomonas crudilactis]
MTTSTPPDNTVLVLRPPMINGQTKLVVGAHIGVPLVAYDLVTDGEGAVVLVDPPSSGTMDPGDVMELWLEDEVTALDSKTIEDPNVRTTLRIPKGRLHPDKVNKLYYTVRRGSANRGTSTPSLEILYNRIRPGFKDRLTDPGGHSELQLLLPDVIKNGVGPDFVSAEVCVAYPYCRAYDLITLKCNGELLDPKPKVNPNQAPQPPNPGDEPPITICFTITRAYLDKAKRLDKKLHFSYTVTDQIGNGPDTDAPWSPVQSVDEDLDGTRLPMPILLERLEDFPGDDASIIDLQKLAGNPLLVVILTADNRFVAGDEVLATYTAKNTGQPADVVVTVPGKVEADPFGSKKTLFLEVPNDKVFAGSNVTVTYELHRPDVGLVGNSNTAKATVTGTNPVELLPPFLVAPAVSPIDLLAYPNGVTMRIEYLQAQGNDKARLVEVNPPTGASPFPLVEFNSNKRVNTVLSPKFLAARHGKVIELRWDLNRNGTPAGQSDSVNIRVLKIADGDARLSTPNIAGNTGTELEVNELATDARIIALKWPSFEPGQPIWVTCKGFDNAGNPVNTNVRSGEPNDSVDGLSVPAPVEWLKLLKDGSQVTVELAVGFAGSTDKAQAVVFPLRLYAVTSIPEFIVDTSPLTLQGRNVSIAGTNTPWERTGADPANTAALRAANGGTRPYVYSSSDDRIASVDDLGTVRSEGNGSAIITVTDSAGQSKSYTVTTGNVINYIYSPSIYVPDFQKWVTSVGGRIIPLDELSTVHTPILNIKYRFTETYAWAYVTRFLRSENNIYYDFLAVNKNGFSARTGYGGDRQSAICMK